MAVGATQHRSAWAPRPAAQEEDGTGMYDNKGFIKVVSVVLLVALGVSVLALVLY